MRLAFKFEPRTATTSQTTGNLVKRGSLGLAGSIRPMIGHPGPQLGPHAHRFRPWCRQLSSPRRRAGGPVKAGACCRRHSRLEAFPAGAPPPRGPASVQLPEDFQVPSAAKKSQTHTCPLAPDKSNAAATDRPDLLLQGLPSLAAPSRARALQVYKHARHRGQLPTAQQTPRLPASSVRCLRISPPCCAHHRRSTRGILSSLGVRSGMAAAGRSSSSAVEETTTKAAASSPAARGRRGVDRQAVDRGVAYVLMVAALVATYALH